MKNNQGYYHWIHSLNNASKQVQYNHAKLLHEAKYNATVSGDVGLKQGGTRVKGNPTAGVVGSGTEEHAGDLAAGIGGMLKKSNEGNPRPLRLGGPTNIKNLANLGREIANQGGLGFGGEEYEDLGDEKGGPGAQTTPEQLATIASMRREKEASIPYRTAGAEDAGVNAARNRARSAESNAALFAKPSVSTGFKNPIGAQARLETGAGVAGDVELAARDAKPTQADLDNNGTVGDAGDVALDASDNSMDGMSPNEITRRANAALPERSMKREKTAQEKAYAQAALGVARKGGSRDEMRSAGRSAWQASMNPVSTPAASETVAQTSAPSASGEKPVLRGREAQIALAQKKGKSLKTESVSNIINRMING